MTNVEDKTPDHPEQQVDTAAVPASKMAKIGHHCNIGLQKLGHLLAKVPLKVILLVAVIGLALKINSETTSVFEPFNVPPELEEKGYTGAEVVHHLNDQMEAIRTQVRQHEEALYMQIPGMQDALQLEMPGTGVSLNQITNLISHFIGTTPQRISGSLSVNEKQLHLTVRISGQPNIILQGAVEEPRRLMYQAAEHVLKYLEPFLLGRYYVAQQRFQDATDLATHLRAGGRPTLENAVTADLIEGWSWYEQKQYTKALRLWNQAFQRNPENTNVLLFQGYVLDDLGRSQEAISKYQKVVSLEPKNVGAFNNWGIALYHLGRFEDAIEQFRHVTELDPLYPDAHNNWGFTLFEMGEYLTGMSKVQEAIRLNPQNPEFYLSLAEGMIYLEEHERAVQRLYALLSVFPQHAEACKILIQALQDSQQLVTMPVVCSEVF